MTGGEIESLSIQAGNLERKLRALKRNIIGIAAAGDAAVAEERAVIPFRAHLVDAEKFWNDFESAWNQRAELRGYIKEDKFPNDQWLATYDEVVTELRRARTSLFTIQDAKAVPEPNQDMTQLAKTLNTTLSNKSHLPKINIPHFSGDLIKWRHYKDTFESIIHNDPSLSDVEKFHYLLGSLTGEASSIISGFSVDAQSYSQAWNKLLRSYDNPRVLANHHLQKILESDVRNIRDEEKRLSTFISTVADNIEAFQRLGLEAPEKFILSVLALRALDDETRRTFELSRDASQDFPSSDEVVEFISKRLTALKLARNISSRKDDSSKYNTFKKPLRFPNRDSTRYNAVALHTSTPGQISSHVGIQHDSVKNKRDTQTRPRRDSSQSRIKDQTPRRSCDLCNKDHDLSHCVAFAQLDLQRRIDHVKGSKICSNCLNEYHATADCKSRWSCRYCKKRHHSLIHPVPSVGLPGKSMPTGKVVHGESAQPSFVGFGSCIEDESQKTFILGTLQALVRGERHMIPVRAVLDPGSHHSFITANLAKKLGSPISKCQVHISGLGGTSVTQPSGSTSCALRPLRTLEEFTVKPLIVDRISPPLPATPIHSSILEGLRGASLADPSFDCPGAVDMLLGVDIFPRIVNGIPSYSGLEELFLLPTVFGAVVMGSVTSTENCHLQMSFFTASSEDICKNLKAFWEIEETTTIKIVDPDERFCEDHFTETHSRDEHGRYVVKLPVKPDHEMPPSNRDCALKRFYNTEKRLKSDHYFATEYTKFMREYEELGHMSPAQSPSSYVIPHHGVWQRGLTGSKLRVVFDASNPSPDNCLNKMLFPGPKLQLDLCNILINFRRYLIPLCTDLVKMYRQILIHPHHRHLQHVFWREAPTMALQEYELNTVTYGLRPSAYLAMRVIKQLVHDEGSKFPLASSRICSSMYVDDLVTGADSLDEAKLLKSELIALFAKGGFTLSKWASTMSELIPETAETLLLHEEDSFHLKILGLAWDPKRDSFMYSIHKPVTIALTKRVILSSIARIFDPLGFLAPVIFQAKVLLQEVWKAKLDWDEPVPQGLSQTWHDLAEEWHFLEEVRIPRYFGNPHHKCHVIGFCDASDKGYAAAVYIRVESPNEGVKTHLVKAKTKVAPLKYVSIARLELCGALLLARLLSSIEPRLSDSEPICYTDSTVVLSWIRKPSHMLRTFEANRVSEILTVTSINCWHHVRSHENPADIASRGCSPANLLKNAMWWNGPKFLEDLNSMSNHDEPQTSIDLFSASQPQDKTSPADQWMKRFSSFQRLIRTTARILRLSKKTNFETTAGCSSSITAEEYSKAELRCVKIVQMEHLPKGLMNGSEIPKEFMSLSPFLDESGIVRVGGRLQNAPLEYSNRHPVLLPRQTHFAQLLVDDMHRRHYHAGPTLTSALIRTKYWIPSSMKFIRGRIRQCTHCRIRDATPIQPIMAALPKERFSQFRCFTNTGIDYAGPFAIKESRRRNAALGKSYLCIFICLASKAVHLEAVSSMTTSAFLAALDRFTARRGLPTTIFSDHGSNFIGASRFLKELYAFIAKNEEKFSEHLSPMNVEWKFIPPRTPHFGGLWEAGVKSVKALLTGIVGKQALTFEELTTVFVKIEGLLNSRPLCPLTEDASDIDYLTPGHLLMGSNLSSIPETTNSILPTSSTSRWRSLQMQINHFWNKWRLQYLNTLQQRRKWQSRSQALEIGDMVIMVEKQTMLGQWPVAKVVKIHPGKDGVTRVVTVLTSSGKCYVRSVSSLAPLFFPKEADK